VRTIGGERGERALVDAVDALTIGNERVHLSIDLR
jgi:hypothetical protein